MLVVDEAAMVGTRKLARLLDHAETAGTKVVLVGDPCQLPEIEAGGTFAGLQDRLGASHLTDNRRQTDAWERATLAELRAGDPDRAFDDYLAHDRVHHAATDDDVRELLVDAWMTARVDGDDVLMVAARLADVDDLNRRARYILRDEGHLGDDQVVLGGRPFAERDTVLALRNDYRLGVLNGTRATVERIDTRRHEMTLAVSGRQRLVVPFAYAEAGHLTHGYATTIHKAQGATVDRCYVLADDTLTREHAYTALSRGRHGNELFVVADDRRARRTACRRGRAGPARDAVRHAMSRSAGKELAVDQVDPHVSTRGAASGRTRKRSRLESASHHPIRAGPIVTVCQQISRVESWLKGSRWRLDTARQALDGLGPIGRLHPPRRSTRVRDTDRTVRGRDHPVRTRTASSSNTTAPGTNRRTVGMPNGSKTAVRTSTGSTSSTNRSERANSLTGQLIGRSNTTSTKDSRWNSDGGP